ncbi:hypothetical protein DPX16_19705 [Anabarilius grahami]|uniref:Retrotransposon gag domain-containing protein n=1 Tax=Anabarilius grahami TaxID=495550 RepID=A0A3N0XQT6_ANAGA|nr:hypothetical protein DPX16_19705 [Anabarilius grahami]
MGIFLFPEHPEPLKVDERLCRLRQGGRPLERYVEEFLEVSNLVSWTDACINVVFLMGLDRDVIRYNEPACNFSLVDSLNLILSLNGSNFEVDKIQRNQSPSPAPSATYWASPAHLTPEPCTYRFNGSTHSWPPAAAAAAEPSAPASAATEPSATASQEPAPAHRPTPSYGPSRTPVNFAKCFLGGGQVPVGGVHVGATHVGGLRTLPWPPKTPNPPWQPSDPDPPWQPSDPDPPWQPSDPDPPWLMDPPWRPPLQSAPLPAPHTIVLSGSPSLPLRLITVIRISLSEPL